MLPDEILSEILSPALKVSDDLFSDASDISPFATYNPSTSAYLLVCKDWLRVATPLLYHVVVLRSKAQANALEKVLHKNPEFGRFIKKLRVEGGYGMAMQTIIKSAPNITDLFLSLAIYSSDGTAGLCKGLPSLNPHRVIVVDPYTSKPPKNKNLAELTKTLLSCLRKWDNLKIFGFPYGSNARFSAIWLARAQALVQELVQSQTIHTIRLSATFRMIPSFIPPICDIPSLRLIEFEQSLESEYRVTSEIDANPKLKTVARYTTVQATDDQSVSSDFIPDVAPSLNPSFIPMESAAEETREIIWKRVLFFALYVEELRDPAFPPWPTSSHPSRLPVLMVSKIFNRLGLPYLYDCPNLTPRSAPLIAKQLQEHPDFGSYIRFLFTPWGALPHHSMLTILSHVTNLESLAPRNSNFNQPIPMSLDVFARTAGPSLREFYACLNISTIPTSSLALFTELRILQLRCVFDVIPTSISTSDALKSLHTLHIHGYKTSLLNVLSIMRLESLHTLVIPLYIDNVLPLNKFLKAHGGSLLHLTIGFIPHDDDDDFTVIDFCPILVTLEFLGQCDVSQLTRKTPHQALTRIVAHELPDDINELSLDMFPALREIHLRHMKWPPTEREISRSKCVRDAEWLLEKGVKVTDSTGKHWVPRVKSTRARKR